MSVSKQKAFVLCNFFVVAMEIASLVIRFAKYEKDMFLYYTVHSNIIAMIVCGASAVLALKGKYLVNLYTFATCLISFTLVVMSVGAPTVEGGYFEMFLVGSCLFNHLTCPLLMIFCYLAYLPKEESLSGCFWAVSVTMMYGTLMYLLNAFRIVDGPYIFFRVHDFSLGLVLAMMGLIIFLALLTSFTLYSIKIGGLKKPRFVAR